MRQLKRTLSLMAFSLAKIPLIFIANPRIVRLTDKVGEIKIPLNYWTKNHLGSMYFGALSIGADCAGGLIAMEMIKKTGQPINLIFKDFKAEFLKRAQGDVHFICTDGPSIKKTVEAAAKTGKRVNTPMTIVATTPSVSGKEPIARFVLTLSLKRAS